ncbi:MAG: inositol 2-dehydrogenase [Alphaproteobacteria bacterium]|nr:MAG: inositol 2-dehydrogenase [Alphaproteobacteria bacterium]
MSLSVCVIGAGRIGRIHASNFAALAGVTVKYIVDPVAEAAEALASGVGATVASLETALADPDVTGVAICSATSTHADLIMRAAAAGKAIFCEKPVALDMDVTKQAVQAVADAGVPLFLAFNRRFDPQFAALKRGIDEGAVGTVEMVQITSRDPAPPPVSYIGLSGGLFKDMMIHDLDMARWVLGEEPTEVSASASCLVDPAIGEAGDVDSAVVTLKTASGRLCQISNSRRASYGYDQRLEVHGSDGLLQLGNVLENTVRHFGAGGGQDGKLLHFFLERYAAAYKAEAEHFRDVMAGTATPAVSGQDGVMALRLAEAAAESLATGRTVKLG